MSAKQFVVDDFKNHLAKNNIDLANDTFKATLCSTFSPSYSAWSSSTSYSEGDIVIPTTRNGHRYRAINGGISASSEPTWPTSRGGEVVDNDITWEEYGGEHSDNESWVDVGANEVPDGDGYSNGGVALSSITVGKASLDPAATQFDAADTTWTSLVKVVRTAWLRKISPRKSLNDGSSDYWTQSGSGTAEYYYNVGDVSSEPLGVFANGRVLTKGTLGSLAQGEWAWGDNDSIGSSTIYVRLTDDSDPDSKAAGYVECILASEPVADPIVSYILLDDTPDDLGLNGVDLTLKWNSNGILELTR